MRLEPVTLYPAALGRALLRQAAAEWRGTPPHRAALSRPKPSGLAAAPTDFRPADPLTGAAILGGVFDLAGTKLVVGPRGDPWDRPSPSRRFAVALHRFDWLPSLIAAGDEGAGEAARLIDGWLRVFGDWSPFAWDPVVLERRVFRWACALPPLSRAAPERADAWRLSLAMQARALLSDVDSERPAEGAAAAAVAGATLDFAGRAPLLERALQRLERALARTVLADGGHCSRSPEAGLELLLDLRTLNDALRQRGLELPPSITESAHRLAAATRALVTPDGRLAAFQGGAAVEPQRVAAALLPWTTEVVADLPDTGYAILAGDRLMVRVDTAAPALVRTACAQPAAVEVWADGAPLIIGSGWSPDALAPVALRLSPAASCATLGDVAPGGRMADAPGSRLSGAPRRVEARRSQDTRGALLEITHDAWLRAHGVRAERRLFLDLQAHELRGEDAALPAGGLREPTELAVRFHLPREVEASVARDGRSVLLRTASGRGWRLRSDAADHRVEPSARVLDARPHRTSQVVLRATVCPSLGARIRWKLSPAAETTA